MRGDEPRTGQTTPEFGAPGNVGSMGQGTARVESRVTGGGAGAGQGFTQGQGGGDEGIIDQARDRARDLLDDARDRAEDLQERAGDVASQARRQVNQTIDQVEDRLEESGILGMVRGNPLLSVGVAFGVGFILAGSSDRGRRRGVMGKAVGQLRGAIMSGVTAVLVQELNSLLDEQGGVSELLSSLTGGGGRGSGR